MKKPKFIIIFVRIEHGANQVIAISQRRKIQESVKLGEKSYLIDYSKPLYIMDLKRYYIINFDTGNQLIPGEKNNILTPGELDVILGTKIVKEITQSVAKRPLEKLLPFVLGVVIGLLAGYLICSIVMQARIDELTDSMLEDVVIISSYIGKFLTI